ncbi:hypothetical protein BgiBS90_008943 [Biomphalaria glabrata]|nr:hypothetical protein BgiBS90_008943 [Biomphalaria glabrata]
MMDCDQIFPCEQSTDYKIGHRNILQGTETNKDINYTNGLCNSLFMSYCQDFLESTEINRTNPELLHFLRFLYREGVENNLRINSSDNQVQNELGEHIANFLQDIKRGKDAKDLHSSIYLFLACLLEKYLKVGNATEPKCSQYKSDQSFCIDYNKINDVSNLDQNNHRIICVPTLRILRDEFKRVMDENISLCTENHMLR